MNGYKGRVSALYTTKDEEGDALSWKFVLSLVFALVVALFAIQNAYSVDVKFLAWEVNISQALIVLVSAIFGALAAAFLGLVNQMKLKAVIRGDKRTITALQDENQAIKVKLEQAEKKAISDVTSAAPDIVQPVE